MGQAAARNDWQIGFRPLVEADFPLMYRWLMTPHVRQWWDPDVDWTPEEIANRYPAEIDPASPTLLYVIQIGQTDAGYIQCYRIADHPEYAEIIDVDEDTAAIDLFIGDVQFLHRGLGPRILTTFLRDILFVHYAVESCLICPAVTNTSAIRAYEKAGFRYVKTIHPPDELTPEWVMRIGRDELPAIGPSSPGVSTEEPRARG